MKRLLIIGQHQFGYLTDTYKYCLHLRDVYDVTYIGWDYRAKPVTLDGVRVISVSRRGPKPVRLARLMAAGFREMARHRYDRVFVVYFQGAALLRLARGGSRILMDIRTGSTRLGAYRRAFDDALLWLECLAFRRISIVSHSLIAQLHLPPGRCHVLPLGGDRRSETHKSFDALRLVYIGTLDMRNIHLTVEGFARFVRECSGLKEIRYDIVGSGPDEDERLVHESIERCSCADQVILHGWIPNAELGPFLDNGNVGVGFVPQVRYYDCQPSTKVFEYLLAGMPTIATQTRENIAVITPENGVLIPDTADGFYRGLLEWYNRRSSFDSTVIRASVADNTWENIVRENLAPYLANTNGPVPRERWGRLLSRATRKRIKAFRLRLPASAARIVNDVDYYLNSRPRIYRDPQHPPAGLTKGVFTLSLDFELAWAWVYAKYPGLDCVAIGLHEREQVPKILKIFDEFMIPATWATVGHLFLRECARGAGGRAHAGLPRLKHFESPEWRFLQGDWYDHDPCSSVDHAPAWYAPDLLERILNARARQEIGCHSFSHAGFGSYCPPEVAAAEIEASREAMRPFGLAPTTFVFPGNDEGNFRALAQQGVRIVRSFPRSPADLSLPVLRPDGLWAVPASSGLTRGDTWTTRHRLTRLKRFVDEAVRTGQCMHLWMHPSLSMDDLNELLVPFLRYCAELREKGLLEIQTMDQLVRTTARTSNLPYGDARS